MTSTESPVRFTFTGRDGTAITAYRWEPAGAPRGVVQLTHGMGEHLLRYDHLATTLDGRGLPRAGPGPPRPRRHRALATDALGQLGADGWNSLVDDIDVLVERTHNRMPDVPVVLFGHSMGSFAAQQYMLDHSGPDRGPRAVRHGGDRPAWSPGSTSTRPIDLSAFNAPFPHRTGYEWLSRDDAQVDAYVADPRCGFGLDAEGGKAMFARAREVADPTGSRASARTCRCTSWWASTTR